MLSPEIDAVAMATSSAAVCVCVCVCVEDLRLQLLDVEHNHHLVKSLYGLLMLVPQSDAFRTLQRRLHCVPSANQLPSSPTDDQRSAITQSVLLLSK